VAHFCVHYVNGLSELFDGEDVRREGPWVIFTVWNSVTSTEYEVRAISQDKVIGWELARPLGVLGGEVVPVEAGEDGDGCVPSESAVGTMVIVEVHESVVGDSSFLV